MEILKNYILPAIAWLCLTGIPSILTIIKYVKDKRAAVEALATALTEQEKAEAEARLQAARNAIVAETKRLVAEAEVLYAETNTLLKRNASSSAGGVKKAYVVQALKTFCLENGYSWTSEDIDAAIEAEVAYTKTVNAKTA